MPLITIASMENSPLDSPNLQPRSAKEMHTLAKEFYTSLGKTPHLQQILKRFGMPLMSSIIFFVGVQGSASSQQTPT